GCGRRRQAVDDDLLDGFGIDVLDPSGGEVLGERLFRRHAHGVEAQGLATAFLDAENRLRRVVEGESLRRQKGEAEPGVQEAAATHEAFAGVFAVYHSVDAGEVGRLVAFAGAGRVELAGGPFRLFYALRRGRMRGEKIGRARIDVRLPGTGFELGIAPHRGEEACRAIGIVTGAPSNADADAVSLELLRAREARQCDLRFRQRQRPRFRIAQYVLHHPTH